MTTTKRHRCLDSRPNVKNASVGRRFAEGEGESERPARASSRKACSTQLVWRFHGGRGRSGGMPKAVFWVYSAAFLESVGEHFRQAGLADFVLGRADIVVNATEDNELVGLVEDRVAGAGIAIPGLAD